MTKRAKTPRSAKDRKKSPERPGKGASVLIQDDDILGLADFIKESEHPVEKADKRSSDRRDALARYMDEIGSVSEPLGPEEERVMAFRIQKSLAEAVARLKKALPAAEKYRDWTPVRQGAKTPVRIARAQEILRAFNPDGLAGAQLEEHVDWSAANERGLGMLKWHDPDAYRVAERFIQANLRLVISLARRYVNGYLPFADLIGEGNCGLVIGVLRFDPGRGYRFSTYASWWIRHALSRSMADKGRMIRLPVHMIDFAAHVNRKRRELIASLDRLPTDDELGKAAGCTTDKLMLLRSGLNVPRSFEEPVGQDREDTLGDFLSDEDDPAPEWAPLVPGTEGEMLAAAMRRLKPIEQDVLRRRFGLEDDEELTLQEIATTYRLSRERIRQIQENALKKLRDHLRHNLMAA